MKPAKSRWRFVNPNKNHMLMGEIVVKLYKIMVYGFQGTKFYFLHES